VTVFIGLDLGSSSVKAAAVDDKGIIRAQAERVYAFDCPSEGRFEVHPERWWELSKAVLAETIAKIDASQIRGISLCGVMMMAVMLDRDRVVVRPTISWLDQRTVPQTRRIQESGLEQTLFEATGTALSPSQTAVALMWVQENEPENFRRIDKVILPKDFLRLKLTGELHSDLTDASATLLLDNRTGTWNQSIIERLGLSQPILPDLVPSTRITGCVVETVACEIGLLPGQRVPVVAGAGDGVSTALGLGIVESGQLGITVGTAGVLMSASPAFVADQKRRCLLFQHPAPNLWYLVTATNTSGEAVRWFSNSFYKNLEEPARYARFIADASDAPSGSHGVIFLPYLAGSRSPHYDALARGAFLGLTVQCGSSDLARAVMEGVAYELRDCFDVHCEVLATKGFTLHDIRISGGIVRNPLWMQILADVLDVPLQVPSSTELGVSGAAMTAAVGVGYYTTHAEAAAQMLSLVETVAPLAQNRSLYQDGYERFRLAYSASNFGAASR
jgi:xylulokinase